MKKYEKILLALAGSTIACLGIYAVLKRLTEIIPVAYIKAEKDTVMPNDKEVSASVKEFAERRKRRAMAKRMARGETWKSIAT